MLRPVGSEPRHAGRGPRAVRDLAAHYARALRAVLARRAYPHLRGVAVAVPGYTDADCGVRAAYAAALGDPDGPAPLSVPVLLSGIHDAVDLADRCARDHRNVTVGLVNPASALAVRAGYLGMHWDGGGPVGHEELLALRTTLLAAHVGLDPGPWRGDRGRARFVPRRP